MYITRITMQAAVTHGALTDESTDRLWTFLAEQPGPGLHLACVLYYPR